MTSPISLLLNFALLTSCASNRAIEGPVRLGQTAFVSGPRVRPDRIIEDSRCPRDVQCIWTGRLIVATTVIGGGWSKQVELTLGMPIDIADGKLTLVSVLPASQTDQQRSMPLAYRFTFDFQGGL